MFSECHTLADSLCSACYLLKDFSGDFILYFILKFNNFKLVNCNRLTRFLVFKFRWLNKPSFFTFVANTSPFEITVLIPLSQLQADMKNSLIDEEPHPFLSNEQQSHIQTQFVE